MFAACASTGSGNDAGGLSLDEAVEQSARVVAGKLPAGTRVAIVAFEAEHENLAAYIMDELTGVLVNSRLEVADRNNLPYVLKELNFQMSGMVDDEGAVGIGKFLGAEYVITGQLVDTGGAYRCRVNVIKVESARHEASERLTVRNDRATKNLVAALRKHQPEAREAAYGGGGRAPPATAGAFLDRGMMFADRGDYEMAIEDYTEAIRLMPDMYPAYLLRGLALFASVSKVNDDKENSSDFFIINENITAEQEVVYARAIADYNQAIRLEPGDFAGYYYRGIAYLSKADYDRAIADFNQSIRLDPNYAYAYNSRGNTYSAKDDYNRAIADYNQAIKLDPNNGYFYTRRGLTYGLKGDNDRAIADLSQAIRLEPDNNSAYAVRGFIYGLKDDYNRAIADYSQAIRLEPNNADNYNHRGIAYKLKRDYDRAIADYSQALRLDPDNTDIYFDRGLMYDAKGDYERAIADYSQVIRLDPYNTNAYGSRGLMYDAKGDYERAIADFNQAIRIVPNFAAYYNNRGYAYMLKEDYDRAIADLSQAIRFDPNFALPYNNRGRIYQDKGDYDRAIADYSQVISRSLKSI